MNEEKINNAEYQCAVPIPEKTSFYISNDAHKRLEAGETLEKILKEKIAKEDEWYICLDDNQLFQKFEIKNDKCPTCEKCNYVNVGKKEAEKLMTKILKNHQNY